MGKVMVSISDKAEKRLRREVAKTYFNRVGALSIVVETALDEHFRRLDEERKPGGERKEEPAR